MWKFQILVSCEFSIDQFRQIFSSKINNRNDSLEKVTEEKTGNEEENPKKEKDGNEQAPPASKKIALNFPTIRLSQLQNLIPKRLRSNNQQTEDLELGGQNKAGLASMETLDDSIKDNETNKDVTDRATIPDEGLETVKVCAFHHVQMLVIFIEKHAEM